LDNQFLGAWQLDTPIAALLQWALDVYGYATKMIFALVSLELVKSRCLAGVHKSLHTFEQSLSDVAAL
jgi:hypothetical protein